MNQRSNMLRRNFGMVMIALGAMGPAPTFSVILTDVPQRYQEQNQWCWAATAQSVLELYGVFLSQSTIAWYGTDGANIWNWTYGYTTDPTRRGVDMILRQYGGINTSIHGALSQTEVQREVDLCGRPVVIRWGWDTGSGHILLGTGLIGDTMYLMDPWYGPTINSYAWVVKGSGHTWTDSLKLESLLPTLSVSPSNSAFGAVPSGTAAERTFIVTNLGAGQVSGRATATAPFSVVSGGSYTLGTGRSQAVMIRYNPTAPGINSSAVTFTGRAGMVCPVTGLAYVLGEAPLTTLLADSVAEFSMVQGQANWYYGYCTADYAIDAFTPFTATGNCCGLGDYWATGQNQWTSLWKYGGHPNGLNGNQGRNRVLQAAIRRWVSQLTGPATITGDLSNCAGPGITCDGGSTLVRIFVDGELVFAQTSTEMSYAVPVNLKVGSIVDFTIDSNGDDVNDGTMFTARIHRTPVLEIRQLDNRLQLRVPVWAANAVLQYTTNLQTGAWLDLPDTFDPTGKLTLGNLPKGTGFFRLRMP